MPHFLSVHLRINHLLMGIVTVNVIVSLQNVESRVTWVSGQACGSVLTVLTEVGRPLRWVVPFPGLHPGVKRERELNRCRYALLPASWSWMRCGHLSECPAALFCTMMDGTLGR